MANGTDALTIALRALDVGPGDEVICPSLTFYATAESIVNAGATPVFCDVDPDTWCITADSARPALTAKTKAIVPVHLFGNVAPVPELRELGVPVVEDAAQAAGAKLDGRRAGSLGERPRSASSPRRTCPAWATAAPWSRATTRLAERARTLRFHGSKDKLHHTDVGYNSRLDELQAAVLRVLLPELEGWNAARRRAAEQYEQRGLGEHARAHGATDGRRARLSPVRGRATDPGELAARLGEAGVGARGYYRTPVHRQPAMARYGRVPTCR